MGAIQARIKSEKKLILRVDIYEKISYTFSSYERYVQEKPNDAKGNPKLHGRQAQARGQAGYLHPKRQHLHGEQ